MSLMSSAMKDITHYFRPSSAKDKQSEGRPTGNDDGKSNSFVVCDEDSKEDCGMYMSDSDFDKESDSVKSKKKPHLIVQVPGISTCENSLRKRKRKAEVNTEAKKNKKSSSPVLEHQKINSENGTMEESFYMSPLRLDSDSSVDEVPVEITSVRRFTSPVLHRSGRKNRMNRNSFLSLTKNKTKNPVGSPHGVNDSFHVREKNEMGDRERNGSLHKYFENVSAVTCDAKRTVIKCKPNESQREESAFTRIMAVKDAGLNGQQVTAGDQVSSQLSPSLISPNDREAGPSSASKASRRISKTTPRKVSDNCKNNTNNNLLNYFDKAVTPRKSKKRVKDKKKNSKEKVKSEAEKDFNPISIGVSSSRETGGPETSGRRSNLESPSSKAEARITKRNSLKNPRRSVKKVKPHAVKAIPNACGLRRKENSSSKDELWFSKLCKIQAKVHNTRLDTRRTRRSQRMVLKRHASILEESEGPSLTRTKAVKKKAKKPSERSLSVMKTIKERKSQMRSENQRKAAAILRRARQQPALKQRIQRERVPDSTIPATTSSDDVIILSKKLKSGETKKIVIRPSFVKLAPLFLAKEELQKKKVFLQSGVPEIVVRRMKQQKRMEVELENANEYPTVSHILQKDSSFPWCLDTSPSLAHHLSLGHIDLQLQSQGDLSSRKLSLGNISSLPPFLTTMLTNLRPPVHGLASPDFSPHLSPDTDGSSHCFCVALSPGISADEESHEYSSADVSMFERVHAWLMRSLLPPGVAFKMCVDLSSFLPSPSPDGFLHNHILALPSNSSAPSLRKEMLFRLKEEYPMFPINRKYKEFYQRRKSDGGLYLLSHLHVQEVITLDSSPCKSRNDKCCSNVDSSDHRGMVTSSGLRRSRRKSSSEQSTPVVEVKKTSDSPSDCGASSILSVNDSALKAPCSSLLTSESWTDIFAPESYSDACSMGRNLKTLEKLSSWLESWAKKSSRKGRNTNGRSDSEEDYSSGIEFSSDDDDDDGKKNKILPTNVAILIGPCGSGKTSSVYALAKEMNYKVLEINASSKRTGKYILAAVKEATRSYQVTSSGGVSSPSSVKSFFKKATPNKSNASIKKKILTKSDKCKEKTSSAMSLIFVEDVDVVFENEDEGFIGALTSLTASTKRPVILEVHTSKPLRMGTTNNWLLEETLTESCPHLINFLTKQNRLPLILPFERSHNNLNAEALLRVACLSEGVWVSKHWSECIFKHTAGDFRRAIQEAQFWAGSVARSSIALENLTRYPKEITQKDEPSDDRIEGGSMVDGHAPVTFCGCVGTSCCSYPYSWMYKDYIQHIWLKLDQIVDTTMQLLQDIVNTGNQTCERLYVVDITLPSTAEDLKSATVFFVAPFIYHNNYSHSNKTSNMPVSPESCQKSVPTEGKNTSSRNSILLSPKAELPLTGPLCKSQLSPSRNGFVKTEEPAAQNKMNSPTILRKSSRTHKANRHLLSYHTMSHQVRCKSESKSPSQVVKAKRKITFTNDSGEKIEEKIMMEDTSEKLNFVLRGQKCFPGGHSFSRKANMIFSDYLDLLCTSDMFLKKFSDAGNCEVGRNLVFEMGNVTNLISMSMQVSSSEKSWEMEARQAKDSCTAAQYQMILPIVPNYWLLNCTSLALDVAPHFRETCRILDEMTKTGKTRTRMSNRLPTINRVGPTLREALCRTLVDDASGEVSPNTETVSSKKDKISE